jgi:hypothetical protein
MNTVRLTQISVTCAAFGLAFGIAALVGSAPARAADDETSIDQQIYNSIMEGLGFKRDGQATITYQERAPLVIPPSRALPAPEKGDAITANNPSWPKDPDVARRKAQIEMERDRNISDEREREQNPLRPDQLTPGGRAKKKQARTDSGRADNGYVSPPSGFDSQLPPSQMGVTGGIASWFSKKEETAKFTGEPPRASLTDPPVGYQTPSPDQPYGVGKAAAPKPTDNYTTRGELSR